MRTRRPDGGRTTESICRARALDVFGRWFRGPLRFADGSTKDKVFDGVADGDMGLRGGQIVRHGLSVDSDAKQRAVAVAVLRFNEDLQSPTLFLPANNE